MRLAAALSLFAVIPGLWHGCAAEPAGEPSGRIAISVAPGGGGLFLISARTGKRLPGVVNEWYGVAISPDGGRVALSSGRGIAVRGLYGGKERILRPEPPPTNFFSIEPAWSPDGARIAFVLRRDVFTISAEGGDLDWVGKGSQPAWTPDSESLVLVRAWSGEAGEMVMVGLDGSGTSRPLGRGADPDVSPNGRDLAYTGPNSGVYVRPLAGGSPRVVSRHGFDPVWSPDGRFIAFTAYTSCGEACSGRTFIKRVRGGKARAVGPVLGDPAGPVDWIR